MFSIISFFTSKIGMVLGGLLAISLAIGGAYLYGRVDGKAACKNDQLEANLEATNKAIKDFNDSGKKILEEMTKQNLINEKVKKNVDAATSKLEKSLATKPVFQNKDCKLDSEDIKLYNDLNKANKPKAAK